MEESFASFDMFEPHAPSEKESVGSPFDHGVISLDR
jgi:hypothetical protein